MTSALKTLVYITAATAMLVVLGLIANQFISDWSLYAQGALGLILGCVTNKALWPLLKWSER